MLKLLALTGFRCLPFSLSVLFLTHTGNTVAKIVSPIVSVVVVTLVGAAATYFQRNRRRNCFRTNGKIHSHVLHPPHPPFFKPGKHTFWNTVISGSVHIESLGPGRDLKLEFCHKHGATREKPMHAFSQKMLNLFFSFKIYTFIYLLERRESRKRRRETSMCGWLSRAPYWGAGLQPRHVP